MEKSFIIGFGGEHFKICLFFQNKKYWKYSLKYNTFLSGLLKINDSISTNHLAKFYSEPNYQKKVIFRARLWDPANNNENWKKEERKILNSERILLNRKLRRKYGDDFIGGINDDRYSRIECPDLILNKTEYKKSQYLKRLKSAGVGIVNQGLENSIGWKMAEYICFSLAVVTNPISQFKLLGEFKEGINYLSYQSLEECLSKTEFLYQNEHFRNKMQEANNQYYHKNVMPGVKLRQIFQLIDIAK